MCLSISAGGLVHARAVVTKVLTAGTGKDHPARDEIVIVN
jgi:hypothetical protein